MTKKRLQVNDGVLLFIKDYSIKEGLVEVPSYLVYYEYKIIWAGVSPSSKLSKIHFTKIMTKYFKGFKVGKRRGYLLETGSFDLGIDNIIKAKRYDRVYESGRKHKRKVKFIDEKEIERFRQDQQTPQTGANRHRVY